MKWSLSGCPWMASVSDTPARWFWRPWAWKADVFSCFQREEAIMRSKVCKGGGRVFRVKFSFSVLYKPEGVAWTFWQRTSWAVGVCPLRRSTYECVQYICITYWCQTTDEKFQFSWWVFGVCRTGWHVAKYLELTFLVCLISARMAFLYLYMQPCSPCISA